MHDYKLDSLAAAVVVRYQPIGDADARGRLHAVPPVEMDGIAAAAVEPEVEFAVGVLLVCFQAMKESGPAWPVITEDEQERQLARFVAATRLGEDIAPSLRSRALRRYISAHPEKSLAAYVASDTSKWLGEVAADESDKYAMLAVWNLVNCIAFAELPRSKRTKPT